jgi:hypothetical protein
MKIHPGLGILRIVTVDCIPGISEKLCTYIFSDKDGAKKFFRNICNEAHCHKVQKPQTRINLKDNILLECDAMSLSE